MRNVVSAPWREQEKKSRDEDRTAPCCIDVFGTDKKSPRQLEAFKDIRGIGQRVCIAIIAHQENRAFVMRRTTQYIRQHGQRQNIKVVLKTTRHVGKRGRLMVIRLRTRVIDV